MLVSLLGCAGLSGPRLQREEFPAARAVVRVAWSRVLIPEVPLLQYKPQEFASAAADDKGRVFIGSSRRIFYALRERDGGVLWEHALTGAVSSEPLLLPAGTIGPSPAVVVGDDDGVLTALSAESGVVQWTYRCRGAIQARPAYDAGMIFFTSGEGRLYALEARSGKWRWQYERDVPENFAIRGTAAPVVANGRVYAGFPDGYLAALQAQSGEILWTRQLSGEAARFTDVDSTPVLHGDTIYASSYASGVFALDVKDGAIRWRFDLEGAGPLALDPVHGRLYVAAAGVYCLDDKGRVVWRQSLAKQGELSQPTLWGPYLLLSAAAGGQYLAEAATGELLQFFNPGRGVSGRPVAHGNHVYVLSNAGVFFAMTTG